MESWRNFAGPEMTKALLLLGLTAFCGLLYQHRHVKFRSKVAGEHTPTWKDRGFGEWTPAKFMYPTIEPCLLPLNEIKPIAYRPFREGPYHVTMGLRSMSWDSWIELDDQYQRYHRIRQHRISTRGDGAIRVLSDAYNPQVVKGGALAAIELVHELAEYLSRRYPTTFRVTVRHDTGCIREGKDVLSSSDEYCDWGWEGAPAVKAIHVAPLDKTYELPLHINDGERAAERALEIAALLVQDDLAIMIEGRDGKYYFQAGAIVVPGFWRLQDKIGMPLEEIHTSGDVPQYREKLETSMARFFRRLAVDRPVARNNYFIQKVPLHSEDEIDPEELGWAATTNGPEDQFAEPHSQGGGEVSVAQMRVRTERQTLRRLGVSGGIAFTIRTYLVPVAALGEERGRLGAALRGWPADVRAYKGGFRGGWWERLVS